MIPRLSFVILLGVGALMFSFGLADFFMAGGWSATGIGTGHAGTPFGIGAILLMGWGIILALAAGAAYGLMRFNRPAQDHPARPKA